MTGNGILVAAPAAITTLALAGTGAGGWALWLLQVAGKAARDPRVQEVVQDASARGVESLREASSTGMRWADDMDTGQEGICLGPWKAAFLLVVFVALAVVACSALVCGCLVAGGGGFWFGRANRNEVLSERLREMQALDALARQAVAGGPGAQRLAALEAGVDPASMQVWCDEWVRAMRGPRRA